MHKNRQREDYVLRWYLFIFLRLKICVVLLTNTTKIEQATKIAAQRAAAAKALIAEQYTGYRVRGTYATTSALKRGEYMRRY